MSESKINLVAPVLRMLAEDNGYYPIVKFSAEHKDGLKIDLKDDFSGENIAKLLMKAFETAAQPADAVVVENVGAFEIIGIKNLSGRAAGKIAVITGAAQGFGLEIAQDFVAQGGCAVLADINLEQAEKQAQKLIEKHGSSRAAAVGINVTDSKSVNDAIDKVIKLYGGIDVLISNAGVLRAQSVKTQSEKDFDFTTDVNYKGYFLCTQAVSKIMSLQHKVNPNYTSDIIQINSKSGLEGSNKNFAYAGSKFGGIGLTQSFAKELIEDGIKVNSICPGNFFDGPLWSDPDNGLFVQYLRSGKVPGAKTVSEVKKFYEAKVPAKRGCTTADVVKAIYYLIEQQYETGQALPVTGGQVMLH